MDSNFTKKGTYYIPNTMPSHTIHHCPSPTSLLTTVLIPTFNLWRLWWQSHNLYLLHERKKYLYTKCLKYLIDLMIKIRAQILNNKILQLTTIIPPKLSRDSGWYIYSTKFLSPSATRNPICVLSSRNSHV